MGRSSMQTASEASDKLARASAIVSNWIGIFLYSGSQYVCKHRPKAFY